MYATDYNIPSSTSQKIYPLFLLYFHIITYNSQTFFALLFQECTEIYRETSLRT